MSELRSYGDTLTAEINGKGVLDIDIVKGCTLGMAARPNGGCYNACYASTIAKFRGIDFGKSVVRKVHNKTQAKHIENAVKNSPDGFFRVGTMGDPCHAWAATVDLIEWLSPFGVPVIITKHWKKASEAQFQALIACGTILNTSLSALDTTAELKHREKQMTRYTAMGGVSIARIVSCEFDRTHPEGGKMAAVQDRLFLLPNILDNPLRVYRTHELVRRGVLKVDVALDLKTKRTISIFKKDTYLGHCNACPDKCGLSSSPDNHPRPEGRQKSLFEATTAT